MTALGRIKLHSIIMGFCANTNGISVKAIENFNNVRIYKR
jgi:hypothetical protein